MPSRCLLICCLFPLAGLWSGCYEEMDAKLHRPHVYLGKPDPHLRPPLVRGQMLAERFEMVQTDR